MLTKKAMEGEVGQEEPVAVADCQVNRWAWQYFVAFPCFSSFDPTAYLLPYCPTALPPGFRARAV